MKNNNGEFEVKIEGQLQTTIETQNQSSSNMQSSKSGGNTPSDLGAIKNNNVPSNGSAPSSSSTPETRTNLNRPAAELNNNLNSDSQQYKKKANSEDPNHKQTNKFQNTRKKGRETNKTISNNNKNIKAKLGNNNKLNPLLNQNRMKNFGKNKDAQVPKVNSSAPFLEGKSGLKSKLPLPKLGLGSLGGGASKKTTSSLLKKTVGKKASFNIFAIFKALPIQVKVAIIGFAGAFCVIIILVLVLAADFSAADGNRKMKDEFIKGDLTEEELCEYLDKNNYLVTENGEVIECEDHPAYKFFVNFKEVKEEYETKYERNRFQVNVELLYETLAYYHADEEFYDKITKDEISDLIDAMLEEIEESCVIKTYDKDKKTCTEKKYVYTLYEFSLNKYISYLKYGTTSTHPNYGNDPDNKSSNGKAVTRICGEGKNTDYVFGFGLVNTSSSPLSEGSDCPNNPVEASDYETLKATKTTLEKLGAYGGVPYYETTYQDSGNGSSSGGGTTPNSSCSGVSVVGSGEGAKVAKYALQFCGNPYVYGGTDLEKGADCSGFVQSVYKKFGYSLNRESKDQASNGKQIACDETTLKAGDLIFYDNPISHVAMYIGDGKIVHAKGSKWGITTDKYNYSSKGINTCRRIIE